MVVRNDTAFALDAADGKTLWQTEGVGGTAGLMGGSSAATDGQLVVIPFISGEILGLVARNGLQVWGTVVTGGRRDLARNNINDISGDPVIDGATIYASNQSGRTVSLDRQSGERHWTLDEGAYGPAWPVGGSVFLMSDEGALVRVDAATGREIWNVQLKQYDNDKKRVSAVTHYGPVLAGGRLWVASGDEFLRAFNPSTAASGRFSASGAQLRPPSSLRYSAPLLNTTSYVKPASANRLSISARVPDPGSRMMKVSPARSFTAPAEPA